MTIEERITALEQALGELTRHPVRDELLTMRDVYGARLDAIDARLRSIEGDLSETNGWVERRFRDIDRNVAAVHERLDGIIAMLQEGRS